MMMVKRNPLFILIFLIGIGLLVGAYYLQMVKHLNPCPLCIAQRLVFIAITVIALFGLLSSKSVLMKVFASLSALFCVGGMAIAGRQVWLQHLPEDAKPSCGPGLDYWLQNFPLWDVVKNVLTGTGECAQVDWTFLSLSLAQWAFLWFGVLLVCSIGAWRRS